MGMLVSVVVPAYNAGKYLGLTIESVLAQTYTDWELVIVDDGSTDDTWEVAGAYARSDPRVMRVQQPNRGQAVARNRGLQECHGAARYVAFLDADDLWEQDALQRLLQTLEATP